MYPRLLEAKGLAGSLLRVAGTFQYLVLFLVRMGQQFLKPQGLSGFLRRENNTEHVPSTKLKTLTDIFSYSVRAYSHGRWNNAQLQREAPGLKPRFHHLPPTSCEASAKMGITKLFVLNFTLTLCQIQYYFVGDGEMVQINSPACSSRGTCLDFIWLLTTIHLYRTLDPEDATPFCPLMVLQSCDADNSCT